MAWMVEFEPAPAITGTRPREIPTATRTTAVVLSRRQRRGFPRRAANHERGSAICDLTVAKGGQRRMVDHSRAVERRRDRRHVAVQYQVRFVEGGHGGLTRLWRLASARRSVPQRRVRRGKRHLPRCAGRGDRACTGACDVWCSRRGSPKWPRRRAATDSVGTSRDISRALRVVRVARQREARRIGPGAARNLRPSRRACNRNAAVPHTVRCSKMPANNTRRESDRRASPISVSRHLTAGIDGVGWNDSEFWRRGWSATLRSSCDPTQTQ